MEGRGYRTRDRVRLSHRTAGAGLRPAFQRCSELSIWNERQHRRQLHCTPGTQRRVVLQRNSAGFQRRPGLGPHRRLAHRTEREEPQNKRGRIVQGQSVEQSWQ